MKQKEINLTEVFCETVFVPDSTSNVIIKGVLVAFSLGLATLYDWVNRTGHYRRIYSTRPLTLKADEINYHFPIRNRDEFHYAGARCLVGVRTRKPGFTETKSIRVTETADFLEAFKKQPTCKAA